ncbi:MAG: hypothetical protein Q4P05_09155, partial [Actinomycetaceae bacterium]|nr:hypothetical protein [Actinomycetaceae bacterium]
MELNSADSQHRPFPTRRELRQAKHQTDSRRKRRGTVFSVASILRASILGGLAAATVALPVSGFVGPDTSMSLPSKVSAVGPAETSWAEAPASEVTVAGSLREVATAASRARVRTPLVVSECVKGTEGANGDRPVDVKPAVVWPMVQGTFNYASPFGNRFHPILG